MNMNTKANTNRIPGCITEYDAPETVMVELRAEGVLCFSSQLVEDFTTEDFKW